MKANELMIGDWFEWHPDAIPADKHFEKVTIKTLQVLLRSKKHCDCCNPIHLTAEILEKNGFSLDGLCEYAPLWASENGRVILSHETNWKNWNVHIDDKYFCTIGNIECDHIHELQHALRLCGLNDLADNFKI